MPLSAASVDINGVALRIIRERTGVTITEAARRAGVKQPSWSNWEKGVRRITSENLQRVCQVLDIDPFAVMVLTPTDLLQRRIDAGKPVAA